jgi:hypothetical protein
MFNYSKLLLNLMLITAFEDTKKSKKNVWDNVVAFTAVAFILVFLIVIVSKAQDNEVAEIMAKNPEFTKLEASVYANNLRTNNDFVLQARNGPIIKLASHRTGTSSIFGPSQSPFTTTNSYHSTTYVPTHSTSFVSTDPKVFRPATYTPINLSQGPTISTSSVPTNQGSFHSATLHQPTPRYFYPYVLTSEEKAAEFLKNYPAVVSVAERTKAFKCLNLLTKKAVLVKLMRPSKNLSFMTSFFEDNLFKNYIAKLRIKQDILDYLSLPIGNPEISDTLVEYFKLLIDPLRFN